MDIETTRRQNLLILLEWAGSAAALAQMAGTAPAYISHIKTGKRELGGDLAARIEASVGLAPGAMSRQGGLDQLKASHQMAARDAVPYSSSNRDAQRAHFALVRRSAARVAAGNGDPEPELQWSDDDPEPYRIGLLRQIGVDADRLAVVTAVGDSMEPRIFAGDSVLVDTTTQVISDGHVYVVWYAGACRVKRLYRTPGGGILIRSDNTARYPDLLVEGDQASSVRVIGRVVHVSGRDGL
jgi:phage repressor protein C with HTH and peptisase S24 domain